jgi:hypothetical protein
MRLFFDRKFSDRTHSSVALQRVLGSIGVWVISYLDLDGTFSFQYRDNAFMAVAGVFIGNRRLLWICVV